MGRTKSSQSIDAKLIRRIRASGAGSVFTPGQFLNLGGRAAVDQALSRLCRAGTIRRIKRGLYDLPRQHPLLGTLSPDPAAVAAAVAARRGGTLQPTGATAANLLGLSEQVPAKMVYLTDARLPKIQLGKLTLEFRRRSPRQMALANRASALVISALRSLGKGRVPVERLARLHRDMPAKDRRQLLEDLPLAPTWMHPHLRYLATGKEKP